MYTTTSMAERLTSDPRFSGIVAEWQVRRLFERQILPPAKRLAGKRVFDESDVDEIASACIARGWLSHAPAKPAKPKTRPKTVTK